MVIADLIPPRQYDLFWFLLAVGLCAVAVGYIVSVLLFTRKMKPETPVVPLPRKVEGTERLALIKEQYVNQLLFLQAQYDEGNLSQRKVYQLVSLYLRNFSHEYSATRAYAMNLQDLKINNAPPALVDMVHTVYPAAFSKNSSELTVQSVVGDAVEVVKRWN